MIPAAFEYLKPATVDEAIDLLLTYDDAHILAGGHSLIPLMKLRLALPRYLIDIGRIPGLSYIREADGFIHIGALTTHATIEHSELLKERLPLLPETAARIGYLHIRNRGTIGGSLAHADPSADLPAAMMALDAEMVVQSPSGLRTVAVNDFLISPLTTSLEPNEILVEIRIPIIPGRTGVAYLKVPHKASFLAVVGVAVVVTLGRDGRCEMARIGVTGLADRAFRAGAVEAALAGKVLDEQAIEAAAKLVAEQIEPLSDSYVSGDYRAHLARVYTARAIRQAAEGVPAS